MWRRVKGPSPSSLCFTKFGNYFIKNTLGTNSNLLIFLITILKVILNNFKLIKNKKIIKQIISFY